jgi:hypothetical protein
MTIRVGRDGLWVTRRDLDAWAEALGVGSDAEGVALLRRLIDRADTADAELFAVYEAVVNGPDDEPGRALGGAIDRTVTSTTELLNLMQGYQRHEKGR